MFIIKVLHEPSLIIIIVHQKVKYNTFVVTGRLIKKVLYRTNAEARNPTTLYKSNQSRVFHWSLATMVQEATRGPS
jgi:hypothetical protein